VRRRLSPPCVAISALPRSFLSLICSVCAHCSTSLCRAFGFRYPLATLALLVPPLFPCPSSCIVLADGGMSEFADDGKVHLRTGLKPYTSRRQAGRETLTTRQLLGRPNPSRYPQVTSRSTDPKPGDS
jgi:hypothetical protein